MFIIEKSLVDLRLCRHMVCTQQIFGECIRQVLFDAVGGSRIHSVQHQEELSASQLCKGKWASLGCVYTDQVALWRGC